jgi:hypothetical protein
MPLTNILSLFALAAMFHNMDIQKVPKTTEAGDVQSARLCSERQLSCLKMLTIATKPLQSAKTNLALIDAAFTDADR